ncbi:aldo/keto reductase [Gemmatimonas aurantiaca]|uniref:aldo/keto reductase n=1 Tax=Gemmatimonas aurantiaca TaxID=173480 RepID=UPI00301CE0F5
MIDVPMLPLNDGTTLPAIGLGTYRLNGAQGVVSMMDAIRSGYHLIDSAVNYENEGAVGEAVRRAGVPREHLRLTSKLPGRHHGYAEALQAIEESLYRAQLEYWDLYLIHWPNPRRALYVEAWQALIEARARGLVRSIGVSNFLPEHLDHLITETDVVPSVNQVEMHPYLPQHAQRAYHAVHGIVTESWSPIGRGRELLQEPVLVNIAEHHTRSVAQVVLRWHVQMGAIPIPKAASPARQAENLGVFDFELTAEEMAAVATLARTDGRLLGLDPATHEEL